MYDWTVCGPCFIILVNVLLDAVSARQCYNYREDPRIRHCDHGCCGKEYAEYCCNVTLQVVGSVIGGVVVIIIMFAVAYYCYSRKTKHRRAATGGGILTRFGLRRNVTHVRPGPDARNQAHRVPLPQPGQISHTHTTPTVYAQQMPGQYPDHNPQYRPECMQPPLAPTAPMPPPYTIEPPPYAAMKGPPSHAPPAYSAVACNPGQGYKYDDYQHENRPPPVN